MSRIDEALRRASGKHRIDVTTTVADTSDGDAAADALMWDLADEPAPSLLTEQRSVVAYAATVVSEPVIEPEAIPQVRQDVALPPVVPVPEIQVPKTPRPAAAVAPVRKPAPVPAPALPAAKVTAAVTAPLRVVSADAEALVTGTTRKDAIEQYRKLAATLYHVQSNRGVRVVLCTSAVMAEGKTVTAANLALTLSQSYQRRVLLIDADLRRPRLHSVFNIPNTEGLYEALEARADRKINVVSISPHLSVVTAGRPGPDPVHVLTSERLARVLEDAGSSFDWVIIDTPPVLVLPDAGLLMSLVDGAVLVVGAGQATHKMVKRAVDALGRDRIIGVVMNRVDDRHVGQAYGGYYEYYGSHAQQSE